MSPPRHAPTGSGRLIPYKGHISEKPPTDTSKPWMKLIYPFEPASIRFGRGSAVEHLPGARLLCCVGIELPTFQSPTFQSKVPHFSRWTVADWLKHYLYPLKYDRHLADQWSTVWAGLRKNAARIQLIEGALRVWKSLFHWSNSIKFVHYWIHTVQYCAAKYI